MKQIPFNLERALAGDKVVTRDGREVTQLHLFNANDAAYPLIGVVDESIGSWTKSGICVKTDKSSRDLFMAPKTVKRWVNFYKGKGNNGSGYSTKEEAEESAKNVDFRLYLAIAVPVEFEEGYGCE